MRCALLLSLSPLLLLAACSATPPANWPRGGAPLEIPRARWVRGELIVDLTPDGRVFINGNHELTLDRAGRVVDFEGEPVALLEPDGRLVGPDEEPLGMVGVLNAALPGEQQAWLTVAETGEVIRYDDEGERRGYGIWMGCQTSAQAHEACTLVTHLVAMRVRETDRSGSGVSIGIGVGVGIPIR